MFTHILQSARGL